MIGIPPEGVVMAGIMEEAVALSRASTLVAHLPVVEDRTMAAPPPAVQSHTGIIEPQWQQPLPAGGKACPPPRTRALQSEAVLGSIGQYWANRPTDRRVPSWAHHPCRSSGSSNKGGGVTDCRRRGPTAVSGSAGRHGMPCSLMTWFTMLS